MTDRMSQLSSTALRFGLIFTQSQPPSPTILLPPTMPFFSLNNKKEEKKRKREIRSGDRKSNKKNTRPKRTEELLSTIGCNANARGPMHEDNAGP